jgi:hypothetical protein
MKVLFGSVIIMSALLLNPGCKGKGSSAKNQEKATDTTSVSDTGFTGIKKYMSGGHVAMETNFKNGV